MLDQLSAWLETQALATRRHNGHVPTHLADEPVGVRLGAQAVYLLPRLLRVVAGIVRVLAVALRAAGQSAARSRGPVATSRPSRARVAAAITSRGVLRSLRSAVGPKVAEPLEPEVREELVEWVESVEPVEPVEEPPAAESVEPVEPVEPVEEPPAAVTPPPAARVPPGSDWPRPMAPAPRRSASSMTKRALPAIALLALGWAIWRWRRR